MRKDIEDLIRSNTVCVLATVADGVPHCSLMSYAQSDDCREIYMVTQSGTKKFRNLTQNPGVSLLIDSRTQGGTTRALTVAGRVHDDLTDADRARIRERLLARHPDLRAFFDDPDAHIIAVRVRSLQLLESLTDAHYEELMD